MKRLLSLFLLSAVAIFAQVVPPDIAVTAYVGQQITLDTSPSSVGSDGKPVPMTLQWKKDGVSITGATTQSLVMPNLQLAASGVYTMVATNSAGSTTSPKATVTIKPAPVAPTIVLQPKSQSLMVGQTAIFSVSVSGTGPFTYQWMKDGVKWSKPDPSALLAEFDNDNIQPEDAGVYTCVITGPGGSVTSAGALLVVVQVTLPTIPSITATVK